MLRFKDAMLLSKAVDKMGIADQVTALFSETDSEKLGMKLFALLSAKLYKAEAEVMAIIVSATGKTNEEVEALSLGEIVNVIKGFFSEEGVKDFLSKSAEDLK